MSARAFVDTNILMSAHDRGAGHRHEVARALVTQLWAERRGVLSTQVLQELYVNVRRKARRPISVDAAKQLMQDYLRWDPVVNDGTTILGAIELELRYQVSFWDALILEAARVGRAEIVYSEDLNHGQSYEGVRVVNPFLDD